MDIKETAQQITDTASNLGVDKIKLEVEKDGKSYVVEANFDKENPSFEAKSKPVVV